MAQENYTISTLLQMLEKELQELNRTRHEYDKNYGNDHGSFRMMGKSEGLETAIAIVKDFDKKAQAEKKRKDRTFYTIDESCDILTIDRSTLWRKRKKGLIETIEIDGKIYLTASEIERIENDL